MSDPGDNLETRRLALQAALDGRKGAAERNRMGQFATPTALARDIVEYGLSLLAPEDNVKFLDPAIGTGAFFSALRAAVSQDRPARATGFEIDPHYGEPAASLWSAEPLEYILADFTTQSPHDQYNLVICNPPYVRHHHLSNADKSRLQSATRRAAGMSLNGLTGLYCHFVGLTHPWMAEHAIAGWLIPSEFMDVNYGAQLKQYLLDRVTLLRIHRFDPDDVQFADALVSSVVVWFRNTPPDMKDDAGRTVAFTFGGSLHEPRIQRDVPVDVLRAEGKWTRFPREPTRTAFGGPTLGDLFEIKRGIATGGNRFFILTEAEAEARDIPETMLRPILPSPRYLSEDFIEADEAGNPRIDPRLFLLDTRLRESELAEQYPAVKAYLDAGRAEGLHEGYICRNRPLWYAQEVRPPAPIVCTYLGRGSKRNARPFRFIRNRSQATVANVYLAMYPKAHLARRMRAEPVVIDRIWQYLNEIDIALMLGEGRVYGGGLHKLEPRELAKVPLPEPETIGLTLTGAATGQAMLFD